MTPLVLALTLTAPTAPPKFTATGSGDETPTGTIIALSLKTGVLLDTLSGEKTVQGPVSLRRWETPQPNFPTSPQLITVGGDRLPGRLTGGDKKAIYFRPSISGDDWPISLGEVAAIWLVTPPADTPPDPAKYTWLVSTPPRDVLLYRNGDAVRGALGGFTDTGVTFTADGGTAHEVALTTLAAIGFNPRFARARKPKEPYAHLVLTDGSRLGVIGPALKEGSLRAKAICGPEIAVPLTKIVSLDVFQGRAVYLSDLKPKKAEVTGFLSEAWPWVADRTVRGQPMRLLTKDGESTLDKGLGTHPKTILTYDLAGKYTRFESLVGLDIATGKRGCADVRIRVDGKEVDLPDLKLLKTGPAVFVRVGLRDAKELTLIVDFGPTGGVQADVDWGNARLITE